MKKLFFLFASFALAALFFSVLEDAPVQSLYYGQSSSRYPTTGYAIMDLGNGNAGLCGINAITDTIGITAAHCLDGANKVYANWGTFNENFQETSPRFEMLAISPDYSESSFNYAPGIADVGIVEFKDELPVSEKAVIRSPQVGCDYHLVGYGQDQYKENFDRKGTDACITNITEYSFELEFDEPAHFCVGDSGSGIYKKGTNEIVGVVSAFYTAPGSDSCADGLAFIAARLDYNLDFLKGYLPSSTYDQYGATDDSQTVENDYFEETHPETINDDGTLNYNNEIEAEIEELGKLFDDIYPEDGNTQDLPDVEQENNIENPIILENPPYIDDSEPSLLGFIPTLILLGACCCLPVLLLIVVIVLVVSRSKKKSTQSQPAEVTQTEAPKQEVDGDTTKS